MVTEPNLNWPANRGRPPGMSLRRIIIPALWRLLHEMTSWHRPLLLFAVLMVVWSVVSVVGMIADPRLLNGDPIWAKPMKFTISLGIYSVTLAWMTSVVRSARLRRVAWWAGTLGVASSIMEIGLITLQAVRGTASHFNISTAFDALIYRLMGSGVVFLYGSALVIGGVLLFSSRIRDRSLIWALRLGLLIGAVGLSVGFLMLNPTSTQMADPGTSLGSHTVGGDSSTTGGLPFLGWDTQNGDLRVAHFIGMHALQILPLLAIGLHAVAGSRLQESTRRTIVLFAAVSYATITAMALWQALRGQSVVDPDTVTWTVTGVAALIGACFGLFTLQRVRRDLIETVIPTDTRARPVLVDR